MTRSVATMIDPPAERHEATSKMAVATLSVLMPVYNERATLPGLLERIAASPVDKEILLVDDCSTDGTREWIRKNVDGVMPGVRVFYHAGNLGKGAAIRTAIPHAEGDYSLIQDGDLEYDPADYPALVGLLQTSGAEAVYGSRFLNGYPAMKPANRLVNLLLAGMVRILYRTRMTDEATCYKAFKTKFLQSIPLQCKRFEFCPEVTAKTIRMGGRILEAPISYTARSFADGKKIRWTDGVSAIWSLIKWRFAKIK